MRIDAFNQVSQIYNPNGKPKVKEVVKASSKDKVEISSFGKAYQTAKQAVNAAPDIREDRIAELREQIANGTYDFSAKGAAEKLMSKYDTFI